LSYLLKWDFKQLYFITNKSINVKILLIISLVLFNIFCNFQSPIKFEEKEIVFNKIKGDSIFVLRKNNGDTMSIFRKIEVLENDNTDTIILGHSIIPPNFKGHIYFAQNGLDKSSSVYIDRSADVDPHSPDSYAKLFTIGIWKKDSNKLFQRLRVKLKLKK
jgi:hypothetical protein